MNLPSLKASKGKDHQNLQLDCLKESVERIIPGPHPAVLLRSAEDAWCYCC